MSSFLDYVGEGSSSTSGKSTDGPVSDQHRSNAMHHARGIHFQNFMQEKVMDLLINTVDLPSLPHADPARPSASDATLFKQALALFQPHDFDDMILERNIYDKCAYALCPRPNLKHNRELRDHVFHRMKEARKLRMNTKEDLEKWCSMECAERALFVRLQLSTEPTWLRGTPGESILLLEEGGEAEAENHLTSTMQGLALQKDSGVNLTCGMQKLALGQSRKDEIEARMETLSLERGLDNTSAGHAITITGIKERSVLSTPRAPQSALDGNDVVEGYKPNNAHLYRHRVSKVAGQDTEMTR